MVIDIIAYDFDGLDNWYVSKKWFDIQWGPPPIEWGGGLYSSSSMVALPILVKVNIPHPAPQVEFADIHSTQSLLADGTFRLSGNIAVAWWPAEHLFSVYFSALISCVIV